MSEIRLVSDFAILDIKKGRQVLAEFYKTMPRTFGATPEAYRIPVIITGYIAGVWGRDDGISQEFYVTVERVETQDIIP